MVAYLIYTVTGHSKSLSFHLCLRLALQLARQLTRLWSILFASSGSASTVLRRGASRIIPEVMSQRLRLSHATIATRSAMTEKVLRTIPNANKSNQKAIEDEGEQSYISLCIFHCFFSFRF